MILGKKLLLVALFILFLYWMAANNGDESLFSIDYGNIGKVSNDSVASGTTDVILVGDILLARDVEVVLDRHGADYPYEGVGELLSTGLVLGNFEAAIPRRHEPTPMLATRFSVATGSLAALGQSGFTHLSLANNHSYDFGTSGLAFTESSLTAENITPIGHPNRVATDTIDYAGQRIGMVTFSAAGNVIDQTHLQFVVEDLATKSDLVLAYVHWGDEYVLVHNEEQQELAERMIDAGADLVVGHHPHVVQDVAVYQNKLIFYSLGNFIFDQYFSEDVQVGLALRLSLNDPKGLELIPVTSIGSRNQPRVMAARERQDFLTALAQRSESQLETAILRGKWELYDELAISP